MAKVKTTRLGSKVIRIPQVIINKYGLTKGEWHVQWFFGDDADIEKDVKGESAVVLYFVRRQN